jgi:hypothetical protein
MLGPDDIDVGTYDRYLWILRMSRIIAQVN